MIHAARIFPSGSLLQEFKGTFFVRDTNTVALEQQQREVDTCLGIVMGDSLFEHLVLCELGFLILRAHSFIHGRHRRETARNVVLLQGFSPEQRRFQIDLFAFEFFQIERRTG